MIYRSLLFIHFKLQVSQIIKSVVIASKAPTTTPFKYNAFLKDKVKVIEPDVSPL